MRPPELGDQEKPTEEDDSALPENVSVIHQGMMFVFSHEPALDEGEEIHLDAEGNEGFIIQIGTFVGTNEITLRKIIGITSKAEGLKRLVEIGDTWGYDLEYLAHLRNSEGKDVALLRIYQRRYEIVDLEEGAQ